MTVPTTPRKRTHPIAAAVALALLAGAVGDTFAADPGESVSPQRRAAPAAPRQAQPPAVAGKAPRAVNMERINRLAQPRMPKQPAQADAPQMGPSRAVDRDRIDALAKPRGVAPRANAQVDIPADQLVRLRQDRAGLERMWKQQQKLFTPVLGARRGHGGMAPAGSEASTRSVEIPAQQIGGDNVMHQLHQADPYQYADRDADLAQLPNVEVPAPLSGSEAAYLLFSAAANAGALTPKQIALAKSRVNQLNFAQRNSGSLEESLQRMGIEFIAVDTGKADDLDEAIDAAIDAAGRRVATALRLEPAIAFGELRGTDRIAVVVVRMPGDDGSTVYRVIDPNRTSGSGEAAVGFYTLDTGERGELRNRSIVDIDPAAVEDAYDGDVAYVIYGRK